MAAILIFGARIFFFENNFRYFDVADIRFVVILGILSGYFIFFEVSLFLIIAVVVTSLVATLTLLILIFLALL